MSCHCLCIGTNYVGTNSELGGCVNDARDIAAKFKPYLATSKVLVNSRATRDGIIKAGRTFLGRLKKGDLGILSFSGHGTREKWEDGYHEGLVADDFKILWDTELGGMVSDYREAGSVVAILVDACHAAGLPRGLGRLTQSDAITRVPRSIPISRCRTHKPELGPKLRALPLAILYLACLAPEYAYDASFNDRGNGAMTRYMLDSTDLKTTETFGNIFKKVKKLLPSEDYPQTPQIVASERNLNTKLGKYRKGS